MHHMQCSPATLLPSRSLLAGHSLTEHRDRETHTLEALRSDSSLLSFCLHPQCRQGRQIHAIQLHQIVSGMPPPIIDGTISLT